jgi:hypothetical protein
MPPGAIYARQFECTKKEILPGQVIILKKSNIFAGVTPVKNLYLPIQVRLQTMLEPA